MLNPKPCDVTRFTHLVTGCLARYTVYEVFVPCQVTVTNLLQECGLTKGVFSTCVPPPHTHMDIDEHRDTKVAHT
jgi:hypothetical protein